MMDVLFSDKSGSDARRSMRLRRVVHQAGTDAKPAKTPQIAETAATYAISGEADVGRRPASYALENPAQKTGSCLKVRHSRCMLAERCGRSGQEIL
jgi:hypothetical protein